MKKFIQICTLFSVLVLFGGAVSAHAQSGFGSQVDIPFSFSVGDHTYEAGSYIIKLDKRATGTATLSIQDTKTDDIQVVMLNVRGDAAEKEIKLVFDTYAGRRYLSKVRTPDATFALVGSKPEKSAETVRNGAGSAEPSAIGGANLF